jgi:hypothetical protein
MTSWWPSGCAKAAISVGLPTSALAQSGSLLDRNSITFGTRVFLVRAVDVKINCTGNLFGRGAIEKTIPRTLAHSRFSYSLDPKR